ncbi:hypothetical protein ACKF11_01185 [Methylobacillus sp. Pita2]|uniref:hypothetical protein n=1 Tax=Methylobacillus sp. Pita2 TaxID=3383245 RepID=UPI0038B49652
MLAADGKVFQPDIAAGPPPLNPSSPEPASLLCFFYGYYAAQSLQSLRQITSLSSPQ